MQVDDVSGGQYQVQFLESDNKKEAPQQGGATTVKRTNSCDKKLASHTQKENTGDPYTSGVGGSMAQPKLA